MKKKNDKHCLSKMSIMAGFRVTEEFQNRLLLAAAMVGLKPSDLIRAGTLRVVEEVEDTGVLKLQPVNRKKEVCEEEAQ